jgi:hypothetical protein
MIEQPSRTNVYSFALCCEPHAAQSEVDLEVMFITESFIQAEH